MHAAPPSPGDFGDRLRALRQELSGAFSSATAACPRAGSVPLSEIEARGNEAREALRQRFGNTP